MILGKEKDVDYRANIDVAKLEQYSKNNRLITDYIFKHLKAVCDAKGIELIILIDGDDMGIYKKEQIGESTISAALTLNKIASEAAHKNNIHFIDLQSYFEKEYAINKKRFSFINDGHWNEYAHDFVAGVLTKYIKFNIKQTSQN